MNKFKMTEIILSGHKGLKLEIHTKDFLKTNLKIYENYTISGSTKKSINLENVWLKSKCMGVGRAGEWRREDGDNCIWTLTKNKN